MFAIRTVTLNCSSICAVFGLRVRRGERVQVSLHSRVFYSPIVGVAVRLVPGAHMLWGRQTGMTAVCSGTTLYRWGPVPIMSGSEV